MSCAHTRHHPVTLPDDLGTCDHCGQRIGGTGLMSPTGETMQLREDGPDLPVVQIFCDDTCLRRHRR